MKKFILIGLTSAALASARAQEAASRPSSSPEMDELREQVKALTDTVKTLQQQVKDQQSTINKLDPQNGAATESPEPSPITAAVSPSPAAAPAASAAAKFPTEDSSVVASSGGAPPLTSPTGVNANGTETGNFPTSDASVVSSTPETISST